MIASSTKSKSSRTWASPPTSSSRGTSFATLVTTVSQSVLGADLQWEALSPTAWESPTVTPLNTT